MKPTKEQELVIVNNGCDLLVSAAAGSGKTAVLVEKIVGRITDKLNPMNVDEFLIVTFSNLAANQMKEKLRKAIEKLIDENPMDEHLSKQLVLLNRAKICTIDKFCKDVVLEYYDKLGIDSSFEIADKGVLKLMQNEVLDKIFAKKYAELFDENAQKSEISGKYADFGELVSLFCKDNADDTKLRDEIIKLYNISMKQPYPERWLKKAIVATNVKTPEKLNKQGWIKRIMQYKINICNDVLEIIKNNKAIVAELDEPLGLDDILTDDEKTVERIISSSTYSEMRDNLDAKINKWTTARFKKTDDPKWISTHEYVIKKSRDSYKKVVKNGNVFASTEDEILESYTSYRKYYIPLILLVIEFMHEYDALKKKKKLFEFSDISHLAYNLLCEKRFDGSVKGTNIAKELSERFKYIYIDEYQDGDYIQEGILTSVSGHEKNIHNMFMVGDVKQSIYGFRNSRPEIFLDKFNRYKTIVPGDSANNSDEVKVLLNKNFRSRKSVLDSVNFFFEQLMRDDLGGINYDETAKLIEGLPHGESPSDVKTEILIAKQYEMIGEKEVATSEFSKEDLEAAMIVDKIKELINPLNPYMVLDRTHDLDENVYRPARPGDITILLRSVKNLGKKLYQALNAANIPVYLEQASGYYEAVELRVVMSLLQTIDNSYQDIPLAAVLLSPIANINENELTIISRQGSEKDEKYSLYDRCNNFILKNQDKIIKSKLKKSAFDKILRFMDKLDEYKTKSKSMSVADFIQYVVYDTGYYNYVSAMPSGMRRKANLDKLMEVARSYENGDYKGLFKFIKYVDRIQLDQLDVGEASTVAMDANVVKIMTMHKSKGLEYPIVFVSELGKGLSSNNIKDLLLADNDYFLNSNQIIDKDRLLVKSESKEAVLSTMKLNQTAEEMRILYVAMTRAMEKLYLTGSITKKLNGFIEKDTSYICANYNSEAKLPYMIRSSEAGFLYWILLCLKNGRYHYNDMDEYISVTEYPYAELEDKIAKTAIGKSIDFHMLILEAEKKGDNEFYQSMKEHLEDKYTYDLYAHMKSKYSISEIKHMNSFEDSTDEVPDETARIGVNGAEDSAADSGVNSANNTADSDVNSAADNTADSDSYTRAGGGPEVRTQQVSQSGFDGATRGTLIHKFMELLRFENLDEGASYQEYYKEVNYEKSELIKENVFTEAEATVIPGSKIAKFLLSDLGQRMISAAHRNELFKEKSFTISYPANEIVKDLKDIDSDGLVIKDCEDAILVQGEIDAYFFEDGKAVLMDYKTDNKDEDGLKSFYWAQLDYYARTMNRLLNMPVDEKIIYSFHNDSVIDVDTDVMRVRERESAKKDAAE